jgi:hypothetical protein
MVARSGTQELPVDEDAKTVQFSHVVLSQNGHIYVLMHKVLS